jgi:PRC-barrel domain
MLGCGQPRAESGRFRPELRFAALRSHGIGGSATEDRMLYPAARLIGLPVTARDGTVGVLDDFLFDDTYWTVRWVVVDTATWLGRAVLLPPSTLRRPDLDRHRLPVDLTRAQVESSPRSVTALPLSRLYEQDLAAHYGTPPYWLAPFWLGAVPEGSLMPEGLSRTAPQNHAAASSAASGVQPDIAEIERNAHLRSVHEMTGYYIRAIDDEIGHVEDFLIEDGSWAIRYLIVDTRNWLPGKRVLISPRWIKEIDWADNTVHIELSRRAIENSPDWNPDAALERNYERLLHRHYGRPGYWE